jgi:hypothetical protein
MQEPEAWTKVSTRMYNVGKAVKWKWDKAGSVLRVMGYTELSVPNMDAATVRFIRTTLDRGYVLRDGHERELLKLVIAAAPKPIGIGYIGRTKMSVYFPEVIDTQAIVKELKTMQQLVDSTKRIPYIAKPMEHGEWNISTRLYVRRERGAGPPPAHFAEARRLLDHYLQSKEAIEHRQPVLDWFESKPVIRVPFASHTRDGAWRGK